MRVKREINVFLDEMVNMEVMKKNKKLSSIISTLLRLIIRIIYWLNFWVTILELLDNDQD